MRSIDVINVIKPRGTIWWSFLIALLLSSIDQQVEGHFPHDNCEGVTTSPDGAEVYVANRGTLLRSEDYGNTWSLVVRRLPSTSSLNTYLALSPYDDRTIYVYNDGIMWRSSDLKDWDELTSSPFNLDPCEYSYFRILKTRTTFTKTYGALIAGTGNVLYKESGSSFTEVYNDNFGNCPSLAAVFDSDTVYAGASNGLLRSDDGGENWNLILPIMNIVEVIATDGEVFVMTTTGICRLDEAMSTCDDLGLPDTDTTEKVRGGLSPPTGMSYDGGVLYVTRANSYAVYMYASNDWTSLSNLAAGAFETLGHVGETVGWEFNDVEEFTHTVGSYVGGFLGLFKTDDGGNSWNYRPTITNAITTMCLSKGNDGKFTLAVGTYTGGLYIGEPNDLKPADTPNTVNGEYYPSLILSPEYDQDGIAFVRTSVLTRYDTGETIFLPELGSEERMQIKGIVFSPNFANDDTVFVVGYNLGILASYDKGETFTTRLFDGAGFPRVYRLVLSPNFSVDGTMACMVDPNTDFNPWGFGYGEIQHIYLSQNGGMSWRRLIWNGKPFRDIVIVAGDPLPIVVAIDDQGRMFARSSDLSGWMAFQRVSNTILSSLRPLGYAKDGLAVSPNGQWLAAAWEEGAIMYGQVSLYTVSNRYNSYPGPWADEQGTVFARSPRSVQDVQGRMLTSHIIFSPDYENDKIIFAADMFSIYISYDEGRIFTEVFNMQS